MSDKPIGVFDSGVGGLTVVEALSRTLPAERLVYLGDTARVPYGSKSAETVVRYSRNAARFLLGHDVKMIVVACNTASAFALDALRAELPVPVLGVVEPGAREAVRATRVRSIGVIGTLGTVRSGAYDRAIALAAGDGAVRVTAHACPLFVPLAEEGWTDGAIAEAVARRYLGELRERAHDLDVLVLGCTHYSILKPVLSRVARELFGHDVVLIDSADAMARATHALLDGEGKTHASLENGALTCFVTDDARIDEVGARFLGRHLGAVTRVDL
jgi:glutamate racemase